MTAAARASKPRLPPIEVPLKVVNELNAHTHWRERQRRAKRQRAIVGWYLMSYQRHGNQVPKLPLTVVLTRLSPRSFDSDGTVASMKFVRDAVAEWLGHDDGDPRIDWRYKHERSELHAVRIEFEAPL